MIKIKKQFIYIIATVVVIAVIAISTVAVLKISNITASQSQTKTNVTKETADALMKSSASTNDATKAKEILRQARQQYVEIKDQDRIQAVDAMILMIDNTPNK